MALTKIPSSLLDTSGGFDLQGNITLGDNEQIQLGASGDLAIYHDGSHSFITDSGTGNLRLQGTNLALQNAAGTKNYFLGSDGGAVTLYHNNDAKIATSSTGATVDGTLTVTGDLDITGNVNSYNVTDLDVTDQTITLGAGQTEANSGGSGIIIDGSSASILWDETGNRFDLSNDLKIGAEDGGQFSLEISGGSTGTAEGGELRLNTAADYDGTYNHYRLDVYEDDFRIGRAGTTDLTINSSGNVGIGTSSPNTLLTMQDDSTVDGSLLTIKNQYRVSTTTADTMGGIAFSAWRDVSSSASYCAAIYAKNTGYPGTSGNLIFATRTNGNADPYDVAERMRIDPSGNVGIGGSPTNYSDHKTLSLYGNTGTGAGFIEFNDTSGNADAVIFSDNGNLFINADYDNTTADSSIRFRVDGSSEKMRIDSSGAVGIGQVPETARFSGHDILQVGGRATFLGNDTVTSTGQTALLDNLYYDASGNFQHRGDARGVAMQFVEGKVIFSNSNQTTGTPTVTTRMTLDNSGNLLVGKTATGIATVGAELKPTGELLATVSGDACAFLNRKTSDGDIIQLRKDNTTVGSIAAKDGDMALGTGDTGLRFIDGSDAITPHNVSTNAGRDNAIDFGTSGARFKDLYLSGGAYLGGTGSANHLDDYEEGTWTPAASGATLSTASGLYTKIGNQVTVHYHVVTTGGLPTSTSVVRIQNLPFTTGSSFTGAAPVYARYYTPNDSTLTSILADGDTFIRLININEQNFDYTIWGELEASHNNSVDIRGTATYIV